jgi:hypothetical protein
MSSFCTFGFQSYHLVFPRLPPIEDAFGVGVPVFCKLTPVMSQKHREPPVIRAYANQDAIDLVSDDDWGEYEARLLQGSSSGTTPTSPERNTTPSPTPSESSPHKRKRGEPAPSVPTDPGERATKRPRRNDEGKSGKRSEIRVGAGVRADPIDMAVHEDIIGADVGVDVGDSTHRARAHSVVDQARGVGSFSIKPPIEIHASASLSRLSGSSGDQSRRSRLGASEGGVTDDVHKTSLPLVSAQTRPPIPSHVKETGDVERNVPPAKPKGTQAGGSGGSKLVKPEKKKSKKQLEAERKALDLREKKMTRREFIQYLYEEKLKEELENAPPKRLVLMGKVIWYAEPGSAKASDSFDRRRYEMVCVPCSVLPFGTLTHPASSLFAMEPPSCRTSTTQQLPMSYSQAT